WARLRMGTEEGSMKVRLTLLATLAFALVSSCAPPAPPAEKAKADAAKVNAEARVVASTIRPGQWRTTTTIEDVNLAGAPAAIAAQVAKQMKGRPITDESCVTSDDIAQFAHKGLVKEDGHQTCTQNSLSTVGGHIEGSSTCTIGGNMQMTIQM